MWNASRRSQLGEGPCRDLLRDSNNRWIVCSSTPDWVQVPVPGPAAASCLSWSLSNVTLVTSLGAEMGQMAHQARQRGRPLNMVSPPTIGTLVCKDHHLWAALTNLTITKLQIEIDDTVCLFNYSKFWKITQPRHRSILMLQHDSSIHTRTVSVCKNAASYFLSIKQHDRCDVQGISK